MSLIGYARVSILEEEPWVQHDALEAVGCKRVFTDRASGAVEERPELARLFDHLREGDTLVVTRLDRLGRSLRDLVDTVGTLAERGVSLRSLDGAFDTTGAKGKPVIGVCATLAEFELDIVRERAALAAVGLREPREARLGALVDAARSRPARRTATEPAEPPPTESSDVPMPDETAALVPRTGRGFARPGRQRRKDLAAAAPAPEPAPEPAPAPEPRRRRRPAPTPTAPAPAPEPDRPRRGRRRVLLAVQILAAAGAAFAALQVGQSGADTAVVLSHTASNADVALGVPEHWRRSSPDLAVAALGLRDPVVLRPGSIGGATIMAGLTSATGASLLPPAVTRRLAGAPRAASVRLGRMTALRYPDLGLAGLTRRMTLFAAPTSGGVLTLACLSPPREAAALRPLCDRVAQSLRLTRARALAPGPSARSQRQLNALVEALDGDRVEQRAQLASAQAPAQQAQWAERLASAYADAAATGAKQRVSPREAAAHARILAAIGAAGNAYARMADAARAANVSDYERARGKVARGEGRLRAALSAVAALGYEIAPARGSGGS